MASRSSGTATAVRDRPRSTGAPAEAVDRGILAKYTIHPAANLFPMMSDDELRQMADDIRQHGLEEPVWRHQGVILDGRNRLVACALARVAPTFQEWRPRTPEDTPYTFVSSMNQWRRHLTTSQRAAIAVKMEDAIKQERARQREERRTAKAAVPTAPFSDAVAAVDRPTGRAKTPGTQLQFTTPAAPPVPLPTGKSREQAAAAMRVSTGYVNDARDLRQASPEAFAAVERGDLSLPAAQEKVVLEAQAAGTLEGLGLRPGAVRDVIERVQRRTSRHDEPKPRIRLQKFGKVESSRTTVQITMTGGNPTVVEDWLNRMQDDPKILDMTFEVVEATRARRARSKT